MGGIAALGGGTATADSIKAEILKLTQKRKDLKRFMDIDKEKKVLESLRAEGEKMRSEATKQALDIVSSANNHAERIKGKAIADCAVAHQSSEKIRSEASEKAGDARKRSDAAGRRIVAAGNAESTVRQRIDSFEVRERRFKEKFAHLLKTFSDLGE